MTLRTLAGRLFARGNGPLAVTLVLLVAAVWMPPLTLPRGTFRYMVTFDVTQSMNVEDMGSPEAPVSRLAYARGAMREALKHLPCGSEVGWAVFADYRALPLLTPLEVCANYDALLSSLDRIDSRMAWVNASSITKGLYWTLRMGKSMGDGTRVVFITDGHESPPLRPSEHSLLNVTPGETGGWLFGVGGDTPIPIPKSDPDGNRIGYWRADEVVQLGAVSGGVAPAQSQEHLSALHEAHLEALARQTGLGYRRVAAPGALTSALLDGRLAHRQPVRTDLRWLPAVLALLLLTWHFLPALGRLPLRRFFGQGKPESSP
ncbi:VWA domain-containing protein [Cupriavidus basilensis]|uniref:VWA domain-containing protein n=1 Tax=Cupriavidus basilensis TaxID=68895 RepID=UPI0020A6939D|nr:VWA domain-containing protein [Cupriavidus basilensis]MCP3023923.1 VWA domain-containing protein [Cupriavidus basilensis]